MLQSSCRQQERLQDERRQSVTAYTSSLYQYQSYNETATASSLLQHSSIEHQQWQEAGDNSDSRTPSLANTSSPSLEEEYSPKTPSSISSGQGNQSFQSAGSKYLPEHTTIESARQYQLPSDESYRAGDVSYTSQDLPSRSKPVQTGMNNVQPMGSQDFSSLQLGAQAQPVIYETAVRSRVARPKPIQDRLGATGSELQPLVTFNSRCHARRKPFGEARACAPPKLKRDTDCTDAIVRLLVCFSTRLVHAIWSPSRTAKSTSFQGPGILPLEVFIQETLRRSKTSYSTLQVALYYLILLKPHIGSMTSVQTDGTPSCRALQCGRRMFLTALILASKYLQDRNCSSRAWSKISGLPINEINDNERRYLGLIQFSLHIEKPTFENWSKVVLTLCKVGEVSLDKSVQKPNASVTGTDSWWSCHLRRLTVDIVKNAESMECYISSLSGSNDLADLSSDTFTGRHESPPSSPDSVVEIANGRTVEKYTPVSASATPLTRNMVDYTASPAMSITLPSRPFPANLPTPQSTPGYGTSLPFPQRSYPPVSRCKASSQALGCLEKQVSNLASLETCPPPRPRPCDPLKMSACPFKRQASSLASSTIATTLTCSPESVISEVSMSSARSRSSSISSNSSVWWPSGSQTSQRGGREQDVSVRKENVPLSSQSLPGAYTFYHSVNPGDVTYVAHESGTTSTTQTAMHTKFQDEGYGSDESAEKLLLQMQQSATIGSDESASDHLITSTVLPAVTSLSDVQQSPKKSHKRERSSTTDTHMQDLVRQFLKPDTAAYFSDSAVAKQQQLPSEKQLQCPSKDWASIKQPVSNISRTKRMALQHSGMKTLTSTSFASTLTSVHLPR